MYDVEYMDIALEQAKIAYALNEVPVGAIVVKDGIVISKAYNRRENDKNVTRHAEIIAIEEACRKLDSWRLDGCCIYTTFEPCMMCMGAIMESRISRLVYGVKKVGNYFPGNNFEVVNGIKKDECLELLQVFFENRR